MLSTSSEFLAGKGIGARSGMWQNCCCTYTGHRGGRGITGKKEKKGDIEVGKEEGNSGSKGGFVELKGCCTFRATGYRCVGLPVRVGRMPTTWGRKQL